MLIKVTSIGNEVHYINIYNISYLREDNERCAIKLKDLPYEFKVMESIGVLSVEIDENFRHNKD